MQRAEPRTAGGAPADRHRQSWLRSDLYGRCLAALGPVAFNRLLEEASDEDRELSALLAPAEMKARVLLRFVCEAGFDGLDGAPVSVNGGGPFTGAQVIEVVARNYGLDERQVAGAVRAFLDRLERAGILAERRGHYRRESSLVAYEDLMWSRAGFTSRRSRPRY